MKTGYPVMIVVMVVAGIKEEAIGLSIVKHVNVFLPAFMIVDRNNEINGLFAKYFF